MLWNTHNHFEIDKSIDTIGLFIIPKGSYYTDGYFYASDTLKLLRTLSKDEQMTLKEIVEAFDGKEKGTSKFILLVPVFVLVLLIFINLNS